MSIYKRKSGRYAVLVHLESSATGLRRRKSVGRFARAKRRRPRNAKRSKRVIVASTFRRKQ